MRRTHRLALLLACTATTWILPGAAAGADTSVVRGELGRRLDDWLRGMERFGMHGAVLVEKDGVIVLRNGYGLADRAGGRGITADTIFDIGSLAKQFTAAAILTLQTRGLLDVHDAIARHLDGVPPDKQGITVHHLLTHTSGLPYQDDGGPVLALPLDFEPGARWSYSNPGYQLLGRIVTRVSGQPFAAYLHEHLFEPAGMHRTCCVGTRPWTLDDVAHGYTDSTDQGAVSGKTVGPQDVGPGGVATCVGDLHRWEQALRAHTVLPEALTELMFTEHARNPGSRVGYGYGWMLLETIRGTRVILHQGNYGGFNSDFRRYLDEDLTIVFLSNHFVQGRSMRDAVVNRLSMLINGGDVPQPPSAPGATEPGDPAADAPDASPIAGSFPQPSGEPLTVVAVPGGVAVTAHDQAGMRSVFAPAAEADEIAFIDACNERTTRILVAAFAGDREVARPLVAPALPFHGAWNALQELTRGLVAAHGAYAGVDIVGTALAGDGRSGRTCASVRLENGSSLVQLTWVSRGVLHITRVDHPPARTFLATGAGEYMAFDVFSARRAALVVDDGRLVIR